jgi:hypothetical protein
MEHEVVLLFSQEPVTGSCPDPYESTQHPSILFRSIHFNINPIYV